MACSRRRIIRHPIYPVRQLEIREGGEAGLGVLRVRKQGAIGLLVLDRQAPGAGGVAAPPPRSALRARGRGSGLASASRRGALVADRRNPDHHAV